MNELDTTVRESLDERAQGYAVPPAPSALILARARREHRRRQVLTAAAGVAAAAVVAVALVPRLGGTGAPPVPAAPSTTHQQSRDVEASRADALTWAAALPQGDPATFTGWPTTQRQGDRVAVRLGDRDVLGPQGFTDLSDPHPVADGWLFVATGATVGRPAILHFSRVTDRATVMARPAGPTSILVDPEGGRFAWLATDGGTTALSIVDIADGSSMGVALPSGLADPALATWTPLGISVVPVGEASTGTVPPGATPAVATTAVALFDTTRNEWVPVAARLEARVVGVVRLDAFGGSPLSALVDTVQGSQKCVSQLEGGLTLVPLECWPLSAAGTPTTAVGPGGKYVLVGLAGSPGSRVTLHDLLAGRAVAGQPGLAQALAAPIEDYAWEGADVFAAVASPSTGSTAAVPFRYDLRTHAGERLPSDPRASLESTFDPATTGLTLPRG
ncbi:MAG TPA: hypothetical protein VFL38_03240 [Humibacillus xanthopallidus]|nr:hypothetical protein [Humibacillus xanthopallidus]